MFFSSSYGANWACSSGSCSGVTIQFEQFETDVDYLSVSADDQQNRAGDILSISLLDPDSGLFVFYCLVYKVYLKLVILLSINVSVLPSQIIQVFEIQIYCSTRV